MIASNPHGPDLAGLSALSPPASFRPLTTDEIETFYNELDTTKTGHIGFRELQRRLVEVYKEVSPDSRKSHQHQLERHRQDVCDRDIEKGWPTSPEHDGVHAFLCSLLPSREPDISKADFIERVRSWNIPSPNQDCFENKDSATRQKIRAHWKMIGPRFLFMMFVFLLTLGMSLWPLIKYANNLPARNALGWGVVIGKCSAGALYPLSFFMILSMSRWFATSCRRFYYLSRFVNWDRHQSFHIWMACICLLFATVHAVAHLSGTFNSASSPSQQEAIAAFLGPQAVGRHYIDYLRSRPGWTGLTALFIFWVIALLSTPYLRSRSYQIFQLSHLLMFPMIGLLCAHGTLRLLQYPMLGFWLIIPTLLVIGERVHRLYRGFISIPTKVEVLDDETVTLTCRKPGGQPWRYTAGQYILVQVPSQSIWQWHPFTISACQGDILQLHIKSNGDWTSKLRTIPADQEISVGLDGPFGAPAQRFYEYDRALIIGAGIGVTPFAAILTDLEMKLKRDVDPWAGRRSSVTAGWRSRISLVEGRRSKTSLAEGRRSMGSLIECQTSNAAEDRRSSAAAIQSRGLPVGSDLGKEIDGQSFNIEVGTPGCSSLDVRTTLAKRKQVLPPARRVDFHWLVREKDDLLWFSSLLNRAHDLLPSPSNPELTLNITTHVTTKRKDISQYIFRILLDAYRSPTQTVSALTGLKTRSSFGRPDFEVILTRFYDDLVRETTSASIGDTTLKQKQCKVGVFYCGPPMIGEILSSLCTKLTRRAQAEKHKFRFDFRIEVFN